MSSFTIPRPFFPDIFFSDRVYRRSVLQLLSDPLVDPLWKVSVKNEITYVAVGPLLPSDLLDESMDEQ